MKTYWTKYCYLWVMFMANLLKRYGKKLRSIILLHLGIVTFRFAYGKDRKPIISMISAFLDVSLSPKTNIVYLLRHQDTQKNPRKFKNMFGKYYLWKSHVLEIANFGNVGKDGHRNIMNIRLNFSGTS